MEPASAAPTGVDANAARRCPPVRCRVRRTAGPTIRPSDGGSATSNCRWGADGAPRDDGMTNHPLGQARGAGARFNGALRRTRARGAVFMSRFAFIVAAMLAAGITSAHAQDKMVVDMRK